jgi:hypothetical protein
VVAENAAVGPRPLDVTLALLNIEAVIASRLLPALELGSGDGS